MERMCVRIPPHSHAHVLQYKFYTTKYVINHLQLLEEEERLPCFCAQILTPNDFSSSY